MISLSQLTQQVAGESGQAAPQGAVRAALHLIQQHGGVGGLASAFEQNGLGGVMSSWLGSGPNAAISPDQLTATVGNQNLAAAAQKAGIPPAAAAAALAAVLPIVVDQLSHHGQASSPPAGSAPHAGGDSLLGGLLQELERR